MSPRLRWGVPSARQQPCLRTLATCLGRKTCRRQLRARTLTVCIVRRRPRRQACRRTGDVAVVGTHTNAVFRSLIARHPRCRVMCVAASRSWPGFDRALAPIDSSACSKNVRIAGRTLAGCSVGSLSVVVWVLGRGGGGGARKHIRGRGSFIARASPGVLPVLSCHFGSVDVRVASTKVHVCVRRTLFIVFIYFWRAALPPSINVCPLQAERAPRQRRARLREAAAGRPRRARRKACPCRARRRSSPRRSMHVVSQPWLRERGAQRSGRMSAVGASICATLWRVRAD